MIDHDYQLDSTWKEGEIGGEGVVHWSQSQVGGRLVFTQKAFTRAPQQLHILSILSLTRGNIGRLHEQHRHRLSIHTSPPSMNLAVVHKRLLLLELFEQQQAKGNKTIRWSEKKGEKKKIREFVLFLEIKQKNLLSSVQNREFLIEIQQLRAINGEVNFRSKSEIILFNNKNHTNKLL